MIFSSSVCTPVSLSVSISLCMPLSLSVSLSLTLSLNVFLLLLYVLCANNQTDDCVCMPYSHI